MNNKENKGQAMEVYFPHLTNGIAKATPTRRQRTRSMRKMLVTAGVFGTLALSVGYAFAHDDLTQDDILRSNVTQEHACLHLKERITFHIEWIDLWAGRTSDEDEYENAIFQADRLSKIYANFCKR